MSKFIDLQNEKKLELAREWMQARKDARVIEAVDWDGQIRSHDELAEERGARISRQDAAAEYEKAKANADKQIEQLQSELATLQGWKEGALQNIEPLRAELTALKETQERISAMLESDHTKRVNPWVVYAAIESILANPESFVVCDECGLPHDKPECPECSTAVPTREDAEADADKPEVRPAAHTFTGE